MRIRRCYLLPLHLLSMLSVLSGAKIANKMDKKFKTQAETWLRVHLRVMRFQKLVW